MKISVLQPACLKAFEASTLSLLLPSRLSLLQVLHLVFGIPFSFSFFVFFLVFPLFCSFFTWVSRFFASVLGIMGYSIEVGSIFG